MVVTADAPKGTKTLGQRLGSLASTAAAVAVAVLCASTALAELASQFWLAELFAHFRLQYAVGLFLLAVTVTVLKRRPTILAAVATLFLCLAGSRVVRALTTPDTRTIANAAVVRLMSFNVYGLNERFDDILATIESERPDVLLILEWQAGHAAHFKTSFAAAGLQPIASLPRDDNFGIAMFSRLPQVTSTVRYWGGTYNPPSILAQFAVGDKELHIAGVHPLPPSSKFDSMRRDRHLFEAAHEIGQLPGNRVLVGDFNLTPWAPAFRDVLRLSGLVDTRGRSLHTTWPALLPLYPFFLIPIDHVLVSPGVVVTERHEAAPSGSDHFAVVATLNF